MERFNNGSGFRRNIPSIVERDIFPEADAALPSFAYSPGTVLLAIAGRSQPLDLRAGTAGVTKDISAENQFLAKIVVEHRYAAPRVRR
jgi:hypothetical protein